MKKFLLTAILTFIGFVGFSNADTVCTSDGFTSQNVDLTFSNDADHIEVGGITYYEYNHAIGEDEGCENGCYVLINSTSPTIQYAGNGRAEGKNYAVSSFPFVLELATEEDVNGFYLYSTSEVESILGNLSFSSSPITCSSSSGGGSSEGSDTLLSGGIFQLSPVISSISTVMGEFIPYVVYIGIGVLLCTLGFTAIKWLVNWFSRKITRYFK